MVQSDYYDEYGNLISGGDGQYYDYSRYYSAVGDGGGRAEAQNLGHENSEGSGGDTAPPGPTPEQIAAAERGTNFEGRSFGQAEENSWLDQARNQGVPQGWLDSFMARNPHDANRAYEQWLDEQTPNGAELRNQGGSGGGGGGGGNGINYTGPFAPPGTTGWMPSYTAPRFQAPAPYQATAFNAPDPYVAPTWDSPDPYTPGTFRAPTIEEAREEPGFKFALEQGMNALNNSAASKGLLRTGGTMKELIGFGQNLGDQNYQNVYNRGLSTFNTNEGNAADAYKTNYVGSRDAYDRTRQGAEDEYRSLWDTAMGNWTAGTKGAQDEYQSLWDTSVQQWQADTRGAEAEFAPRQTEATTGFQASMDQWLEKMRIAGLIEQDSD